MRLDGNEGAEQMSQDGPKRPKTFEVVRDERGGVLVLVAVVMVALFGMAALAVDVGMGYTAKIDAQRAADAGALAGASAFLDFQAAVAVQPAEDRAYEFALRNDVRAIQVDSSEVTVQVLPDSFKVRVWVQRQSIGTWFARLIGFDQLTVLGAAAAQATEAGAARCLKPLAVPDIWHDADDDTDGDRVWDEGEEWVLGSHPDDRYIPYEGPGGPADATGYGSDWRDASQDFGRQINLKMPDPQSEYVPSPGVFLPWRIPLDEDQEPCGQGGGGGQDAGGAVYRRNICSCNSSSIELGAEYPIEPGNMIGPTSQGVDELISEDPDAWWDPSLGANGGIRNSAYGDGLSSPRVVKLAMFDPSQIEGSGMQTIRFNNFALMFIEDQASQHDPVVGRFLYYVSGEESAGPVTGSLARYLRLVE
jgi:hypothetical protein